MARANYMLKLPVAVILGMFISANAGFAESSSSYQKLWAMYAQTPQFHSLVENRETETESESFREALDQLIATGQPPKQVPTTSSKVGIFANSVDFPSVSLGEWQKFLAKMKSAAPAEVKIPSALVADALVRDALSLSWLVQADQWEKQTTAQLLKLIGQGDTSLCTSNRLGISQSSQIKIRSDIAELFHLNASDVDRVLDGK